MNNSNIQLLDTFTLENIPDLDVAVLGALELFQKASLPKIDTSAYKRPLVVGSGNAEATGRIIFEDVDAVFASESTFEEKLRAIVTIDSVIIISASGAKHAPIIAEQAQRAGKPVVLITNTDMSPAAQYADQVCVFPKNREPYTYNTSTYLGMILGHTGENPAEIDQFIREDVASLALPDFSKYDKYFFIVPARFSGIVRMLEVKCIELFGRNIARDVETVEYMRHATTVAPSNELFVSFGEENTIWGDPEHRFFVPLPENANYAAMMAIGYFTVAHIQKKHPPYFKEHIVAYTKKASELFGSPIHPIVEK